MPDHIVLANAIERLLKGWRIEQLPAREHEALQAFYALLMDAPSDRDVHRGLARQMRAGGLSVSEIARRLDRPRTTISSWLTRGT